MDDFFVRGCIKLSGSIRQYECSVGGCAKRGNSVSFFSDAPQSVLTARQGRQVRYGVRAARGAEALVCGPGEMAKGVPGRAPPCRDKTVGYVQLNQCRVSGRGVPEGCYFTAYFLPFTM